MRLARWIVWGCVLFIISGCSLHTRHQDPWPVALRSLELVSFNPYSQFSKQLRQSLLNRGARLYAKAPIRLRILAEDLSERIISISLSTNTRQKLLTLQIQYQLEDAKGAIIGQQQTVLVKKFVTLDSNEILGSMTQEQQIELELTQQAVRQLLNQLVIRFSGTAEGS